MIVKSDGGVKKRQFTLEPCTLPYPAPGRSIICGSKRSE